MNNVESGHQLVLSTGVFALFSGWALAQNASNCKETDPISFLHRSMLRYNLTSLHLIEMGGNLLSENEIFIQKSRHYFSEFKDFPPVTISMERFASVTENKSNCSGELESKITVLGPN